MSMIRNLVKEPENKSKKIKKSDEGDDSKDDEPKKPRPIIKSATDLQRLKLEKLMKNPDKPISIPEQRREKDHMQSVPTFVRNVMGSSAGAGSGEFHVYRHLRRKEYARQKAIQAKSTREQMDDDYHSKLEENKRAAEEKTAKKRAKRLKKKQRQRNNKRSRPADQQSEQMNSHTETSESDNDDGADKVPVNEERSPHKQQSSEEQSNDGIDKVSLIVNNEDSPTSDNNIPIATEIPPSPEEIVKEGP